MGQQTSPNSTPPGMPGNNPAHAGKYSFPNFPSMAAFTAAITPGATGYSADLWNNGFRMTIAGEPIVATRIWNGSHARTVLLGTASLVLASDASVLLATSGTPPGGIGTVGDVAIDMGAGVYYGKTGSNAWSAPTSYVGGAAGSGIVQAGFSTTIPLQNAATQMPRQTVSSALTFVPGADPVAGATCNVTLVGDGNSAHVPNLSAFPLLLSSSLWDNTGKNMITFGFDGVDLFSFITQLP